MSENRGEQTSEEEKEPLSPERIKIVSNFMNYWKKYHGSEDLYIDELMDPKRGQEFKDEMTKRGIAWEELLQWNRYMHNLPPKE